MVQPLDDSLTDMVLALLADTERRTLPDLTREEIHALGLRPVHQLDSEWADALSERERGLLGSAGTRSLAVRGLVHLEDDHLAPADDLLVLACALTSSVWSLILSNPSAESQLLFRGLPDTQACVVAAYADGIHAHALATDEAGFREAAMWLLDDSAEGPSRAVHVVAVGHPTGLDARITLVDDAAVLQPADGETVPVDQVELAAWLARAVSGVD